MLENIILKEGEIKPFVIRRLIYGINKLPNKILKQFIKQEWKIRVFEKNIIKDYYDLSNPSWGVCSFGDNEIGIEQNTFFNPSHYLQDDILHHEFGHYIHDEFLLAKQRRLLKEIHKNTKRFITKRSKENSEELFAECFSYYYNKISKKLGEKYNRPSRKTLKKIHPEIFCFLEGLILGLENENLS